MKGEWIKTFELGRPECLKWSQAMLPLAGELSISEELVQTARRRAEDRLSLESLRAIGRMAAREVDLVVSRRTPAAPAGVRPRPVSDCVSRCAGRCRCCPAARREPRIWVLAEQARART